MDLPIDSMVIFHSYVAVYQRATTNNHNGCIMVYLKMEYTPKIFVAILYGKIPATSRVGVQFSVGESPR